LASESPEAESSRPWIVPEVDARRGGGPPDFAGGEGRFDEPIWDRICFYSSPFGEPKTEKREHSDGLLKAVIEPAIAAVDSRLQVVRADQLPSSSITGGLYKYVECARLVIADLSFHNPNVLHEIGVRHGKNLPCVLVSRQEDPIPSNLRDLRIAQLNTSRVWDFDAEVARMQGEITEQVRWALSGDTGHFGPLWLPFAQGRRPEEGPIA
jgi:hypothetical protein